MVLKGVCWSDTGRVAGGDRQIKPVVAASRKFLAMKRDPKFKLFHNL